jgi:hypothetical protein
MAKDFEERRQVNIVQVLDWIDRYGGLLEFLDNDVGAFGQCVIQVHGRRAVKACLAGKWKVLPQCAWEIDASSKEK